MSDTSSATGATAAGQRRNTVVMFAALAVCLALAFVARAAPGTASGAGIASPSHQEGGQVRQKESSRKVGYRRRYVWNRSA